jgi:hypothetical protein
MALFFYSFHYKKKIISSTSFGHADQNILPHFVLQRGKVHFLEGLIRSIAPSD